MIVPVMAISNLVLIRQIYSEETNGAHAHYSKPVPLKSLMSSGCGSQGCHGYLPGSLAAPFSFTRHGTTLLSMSIYCQWI